MRKRRPLSTLPGTEKLVEMPPRRSDSKGDPPNGKSQTPWVTLDKELWFKVHLADKAGKATKVALALRRLKGLQPKSVKQLAKELGATSGGLRVADTVPACDARAYAAPPAGAEDHGASCHQGVPYRCSLDSGGGSRLADRPRPQMQCCGMCFSHVS